MLRHFMLLAPLTLIACAETPATDAFLKARFGCADGVATFDTERFIVVFESVPLKEGLKGSEWDLKVSGPVKAVQNCGLSRTTPEGTNLKSEYVDGVNTITIRDIERFELRIRDGGRIAEVDGLTIDLSRRKRSIVVHADGTVTVS